MPNNRDKVDWQMHLAKGCGVPRRMNPLWLLAGISALATGLLAQTATPSIPAWWTASESPIISTTAAPNNYAPVNLGQLKHVASMAYAYLDDALPNGLDFALTDIIPAPPPQGEAGTTTRSAYDVWMASNYAPANLGQLKAVAKPFYDALIAVGYDTHAHLITYGYPATWTLSYPWNPTTPVSQNYVPVNIGQLKMVFSFDLEGSSLLTDTDMDGIPDWMESLLGFSTTSGTTYGGISDSFWLANNLSPIFDLDADLDGDGSFNLAETLAGTNLLNPDSDGDGIPDGWELLYELNPNDATDAVLNPDGDMFDNFLEYVFGQNPRRNDQQIGILSAGTNETFIVGSDGLYGTGRNVNGAMANGTTILGDYRWGKISTLTVSIKKALSSEGSFYAVDENGNVWSWGYNGSPSMLGLGSITTSYVTTPTQMQNLSSVVDVASGQSFGLALIATSSSTAIYSWGRYSSYGLGSLNTSSRTIAQAIDSVSGFPQIKQIAAGVSHALACGVDGTVWTWGSNSNHQLGTTYSALSYSRLPIQVGSLSSVSAVAACDYASIALKSDGTVWTWGAGNNGELGTGATAKSAIPTQVIKSVDNLPLTNIVKIKSTQQTVFALDKDGNLWGWGDGSYSRFLSDSSATQIRARQILLPDDARIVDMTLGPNVSIALDSKGRLWGWGNKAYLGLGETAGQYNKPIELDFPASQTAWNIDANTGQSFDSRLAKVFGFNPQTDSDNDGIPDYLELILKTSPYDSDTDGDGISDKDDYFPLDSTRWQRPPHAADASGGPEIYLSTPAAAELLVTP